MNAAEEMIVYGTINQQMSVNALYDMNKDIPLWENQCNKFYGPRSNKETPGDFTMAQVAQILDDAGLDGETYVIEQSTSFFDRNALFNNFNLIGKGHLIPGPERVLRLVKAWRMALWNFKILVYRALIFQPPGQIPPCT
jgi:hypothetical protein